jgi:hypothetical protein
MLSPLQQTAHPIVGNAASSYGRPEWVAALIVLAAALLVVFYRRYDAARGAKWGAGAAVRFGLGIIRKKSYKPPAGGQDLSDYHGLLVGTDNRASTSKATAALWTVIVAYFLITMALVLGYDYAKFQTLIGNTSPIYLIFLGGPFAAAVIAKTVVSGAVADGNQQKSDADAPRVADVFSDDDGNTDLVDLQYVVFNLIVAGIVLAQFLHAPGFGAPAVPSFLAGLTSASAATYIANKGLTTSNSNSPSIDRFLPASVRAGGRTAVLGSNLIAPGDSIAPTIIIGSTATPDDPTSEAANTPPSPDRIVFQVTPGTPVGRPRVVVRTPSDLEANSDQLPGTDALNVVQDALVVSAASPTNAGGGSTFTLLGSGFYNAVDVDADGNPVGPAAVLDAQGNLPKAPTTISLIRQDPANPARTIGNPTDCPYASGTDGTLTVTVPGGLLQGLNVNSAWFNVIARRQGLPQVNPNIAINITS